MESEYLDFEEVANARPDMKTKVWAVRSKRHGNVLGFIRWYGAWRQYTFWPSEGTIWNPQCMADIQTFINGRMAERKVV